MLDALLGIWMMNLVIAYWYRTRDTLTIHTVLWAAVGLSAGIVASDLLGRLLIR